MTDTKEQSPVYFDNITAIVMAGGKSSRMGTDKSQLEVGGKSLIEHILDQLRNYFREILISSNDIKRFEGLGFKVVADQIKERGPLVGLISTIAASTNDLSFIQACDIPETNTNLIARMVALADGVDAVVPRSGDGRLEPLFALYRKSALEAMKYVLENERGRVHMVPKHCRTAIVDLEPFEEFVNLNTPSDYKAFLAKYSS